MIALGQNLNSNNKKNNFIVTSLSLETILVYSNRTPNPGKIKNRFDILLGTSFCKSLYNGSICIKKIITGHA